MKKWKVKPTKKQLDVIKEFWRQRCNAEEQYQMMVAYLEKDMERLTHIKGIEFFLCNDGYYAGVGNAKRTMKLIQEKELEND